MKRVLALLFTVLLSGCLTYDSYGYRGDGYYEDRYYSGGRSNYDGYYSAYGSDYAYWNHYPDYVYGSAYYSVLWPVYRGYYDPFHSPGFYYGITWYPHTYFGLGHSWYSWPYYHAYSPYRYSYWDGYYDRWDQRRAEVSGRVRRGQSATVSHPYHYGSARNEAERLAYQSGVGHQQRGLGQPGVQYDPFAAQQSSGLSRNLARGATHARSQMPARYQGNGGRGELPTRAPLQRSPEPYRTRIERPVRSSEPARTQRQERSAERLRASESGWVSAAPGNTPEPGAHAQLQRGRPAPYYREVAGSQVPMTRQQPLAQPRAAGVPIEYSRSRETPDYRAVREAPVYRSERGYRNEQQSAPATQTYPRAAMPSRQTYESRPAQRFESAAPSYPSRSADSSSARGQASESRSSGSAREESRRVRDED